MTVRPATPGESLPVVLACHQTITAEGEALRAALADFSAGQHPGSPQELAGRLVLSMLQRPAHLHRPADSARPAG